MSWFPLFPDISERSIDLAFATLQERARDRRRRRAVRNGQAAGALRPVGRQADEAQDLKKSYVVRIIVWSEGSLEIWYVKAIASRVYVYMHRACTGSMSSDRRTPLALLGAVLLEPETLLDELDCLGIAGVLVREGDT